ncbi:copper chaperone PCu(A)C [Microbulbifer flavimaris]|uniref:Copper chaperone PCu(A)C n=1 Tax=Microbulbifer flavimaris TaxID=1781068 RepID=A0ABX4HYE2_9GAMM|nr:MULTISPECIES: copper chaperone PCu(A)C [Microbulbifer]KUJ82751.1 hypothetical protein AVO43_09255 [Microbulbifer sp. ZGT114]PCO04926.1 copper chaperone PCu(A)C [Microbulbifer flavimaris]
MIEAIKRFRLLEKSLIAALLQLAAAGAVAGEEHVHGATADSASRMLQIHGYARETLPGLSTSAAYLKLSNPTTVERQLISVALASEDSARASLHTTEERDGISRMRPLEKLAIPAGQTVQMSPGGLHVMLEGVQLRAGAEVSLLVHFANGETREVTLPIRSLQAEGQHHHHHHHG